MTLLLKCANIDSVKEVIVMTNKIGHILDTSKENKFIMTQYVGSGSGTLDNKQNVSYEVLIAMDCAPVVKYGRKYYSLTWEDILDLAEKNGLFEKEDKDGE